LTIQNVGSKAFKSLLEWIYTGNVEIFSEISSKGEQPGNASIDITFAFEILTLATRYKLKTLETWCEVIVMDHLDVNRQVLYSSLNMDEY
jgi:hypothetical protein